jgi:hypothetical protein
MNELINWVSTSCGIVCDVFLGKHPEAYSIIGLGIVTLIFLRLRKIDQFVKEMHIETEALKKIARFPYCEECGYKDSCNKRIAEMDECQREHRAQVASS